LLKSRKIPARTGYADSDFTCKNARLPKPAGHTRYTQPELLEYSQQLIGVARKLSAPQIGKLMSISDKLADLNATRFHDWHPDFTPQNARQAILAFKGDVYTGLQAETSAKTISILPSSICACFPACTACCARWI
jgi:cytoplasmic iron level regulating protein YaaA (DUF328/UPF0246 family)